MKKFSIILSLLVITISCKGNENKDQDDVSGTSNQQEQTLKRYSVKSGIVSYQTTISGSVIGGTVKGRGTSSLYFKNWGRLELREEESNQTTTVSVMGHTNTQKNHVHVMNKLDNGESYLADFEKKQITVGRDPMTDLFKQSNTNATESTKSMLESMGGKKVGDESILGYDCEIWDVMGAKQWIYKGVMLKMEVTVLGIKTITEAITAKFDIAVGDSKFQLPDFPVQKTESFMNNEKFDSEMGNMQDELNKLSKLSFQEWKAMVTKNDPEMKEMSDEELRQTYNMIQKMAK